VQVLKIGEDGRKKSRGKKGLCRRLTMVRLEGPA